MGNGTSTERRLRNPGSFERLHRLCKDVFPQQLEGVKLIINKHLSSHFQAAHTIHLSSMSPHYHFKAMYSGDQQADSNESFPQALGEVDSTGSLNAQCVALLASRIRAKAAFQTQQERFQTWQFDTEYRGDSFTATITLGNPDIISESVILVAHFLQSITHNLVLGGEMVYHRRPAEEGAIFTLAAKYTTSHWVGTLNIGRGGAHASYYHQANDQGPHELCAEESFVNGLMTLRKKEKASLAERSTEKQQVWLLPCSARTPDSILTSSAVHVELTCSPCVYMSFPQLLQFPLISQ
ncbi:mitochondrial import receptor subunit TOM40B-like isoform X3 [Hypanus sabinus]|uniref:mitochondrial import receptor subunit TOM40B-like isoform X3 n=1 Tax=Hypanus sabinus TaxID=79690 RepID=UPI0028C4239B|nr:mitochondrial import receptor subunit TOM40B-like isoform X3 [Hypanus sabinus]